MARQRKSQAAQAAVSKPKGNGIMPLSNDQIMALLSKTRQKGVYTDRLNEFIASGEGGLCVNEQWPDLGGKKATTLKQGFEAAKDKKEASEGADKVIVKTDEDKVYLINLAHVEGVEVAA
jgi:hypothetical protein